MGGWADKDDIVDPATGDSQCSTGALSQPNFYGGWGGDWAIWGGGTWQVTPQAAINVQLSYDDFENFAAVANVAYELVPGFTITPEIAYADNFSDTCPALATSVLSIVSMTMTVTSKLTAASAASSACSVTSNQLQS